MDAAIVDMGGGEYMVRGRCRCGRLTQLCGMDRMACLRLTPQRDGGVLLTAGGGRWLDKAVTAVIFALVQPALMLLPAAGAVRQATLLYRILQIARGRLTAPA